MELKQDDLEITIKCIKPDGYISILKKSAVEVTHKPTGIVAICGYYRSQHKNKLACLKMIEMALTNF